jgi:hypothetical protein
MELEPPMITTRVGAIPNVYALVKETVPYAVKEVSYAGG